MVPLIYAKQILSDGSRSITIIKHIHNRGSYFRAPTLRAHRKYLEHGAVLLEADVLRAPSPSFQIVARKAMRARRHEFHKRWLKP